MDFLVLLVIFGALGLAFGWLRWGTHVVVLGALALWIYSYIATGGDLYGDGEVSAAYWAMLAGVSVIGALFGGTMARSIRLSLRERRSPPE